MSASAKLPPKKPIAKAAAKPGKDVIYIDVDDEITSIIDKVQGSKQKIVALVLPKRMAALQSTVNMRLLKRSTDKASKNVVLITSEHALLPLAGVAGLHVAKNLQSAPEIPPSPRGDAPVEVGGSEAEVPEDSDEPVDDSASKIDYSKPVGELAASSDDPIALDNDDDEGDIKSAAAGAVAVGAGKKAKKLSKAKGLKVPNFDRFRLIILLGGAAFIGLIIFIILGITVLPKAKITIKTSSTPVSLSTNLTASGTATALDTSKKIIPSVLKASDQTANQSVQATGQQNNGEKASGKVSMTAGACSADVPSDVPAGVGISSSGSTFIMQERASFSPSVSGGKCTYKSNTVSVTAQTAGAKYNLPSGTSFTVAGYPNVSAAASGAMSGGTDNNITILTQNDVDSAKAKISSADSDKFTKDFENQLGTDGYYVFASTLKVGDPATTASPAVGQPASSANVSVKITYTILAVKKDDLKTVISDALDKQIDKKKERLSDADPLQNLTVTVQNQDKANAILAISKDTTAVPIIDDNSVKTQAVGKKESEIRASLVNIPGVKEVDVHMSPFWVTKAPKVGKITVVEQQVKQDN